MNDLFLVFERWQILHKFREHQLELQEKEHEQIDFEEVRNHYKLARVKSELKR